MHLGSARAVLTGTVLLALLGSGCSGDNGNAAPAPPPPTGTPAPLPVDAQWPDPLVPHSVDTGSVGDLALTTDELVVAQEGPTLTAYDVLNGTPVWTVTAPGRQSWCRFSAPREDVVAVALGDCAGPGTVGALDLARGRLLWSSPAPDLGRSIAVGSSTVTAVAECGAVATFALSDGQRTRELVPADPACTRSSWTDGDLVVTLGNAGQLAPGQLVAYDASDGKQLWSRTTPATEPALTGIAASDPLVLGVGEGDDVRLRAVDDAGAPGTAYGWQLGRSGEVFTPVGVVDGVLVGSYDLTDQPAPGTPWPAGAALHGFDLATGRTLWTLPPATNSRLLGVHGGRLVVGHERVGPAAERGVWVTSHDARDAGTGAVLGWVDGYDVALAGARLVDLTRLGLIDLPTTDLGIGLPIPPLEQLARKAPRDAPVEHWSQWCRLTPETLAALGFRLTTLPAVPPCVRAEKFASGPYRHLEVTLEALPGLAHESGVSRAGAVLATRRASLGGTAVPVAGVGDEAFAGSGPVNELLVRSGNVVVLLRLRVEGPGPDPRAALVRAARELLMPHGLADGSR